MWRSKVVKRIKSKKESHKIKYLNSEDFEKLRSHLKLFHKTFKPFRVSFSFTHPFPISDPFTFINIF